MGRPVGPLRPELDAPERMLADFAPYPLLPVLNKVPPRPPARQVERLQSRSGERPVVPPISEHRWLTRRLWRAAVTSQLNPGRQVRAAGAIAQAAESSVALSSERANRATRRDDDSGSSWPAGGVGASTRHPLEVTRTAYDGGFFGRPSRSRNNRASTVL